MSMKTYFSFPKAPGLDTHYQIVYCHIKDTCLEWGALTPSETHLLYSTAPTDWAGVVCLSVFYFECTRACVCVCVCAFPFPFVRTRACECAYVCVIIDIHFVNTYIHRKIDL